MKIILPGQDVPVDTSVGVDLIWYEKFQQLAGLAYSDGSFATPVLTAPSGTVPTFTDVPLTANYYKVGRVVTMNYQASNLAGGTPGAGGGHLSVSLPFPVSNVSIGGAFAAGAYADGGNENLLFVKVIPGASTALLYKQTVAGTNVNLAPLLCSDLSSAIRALSIQFSYLV